MAPLATSALEHVRPGGGFKTEAILMKKVNNTYSKMSISVFANIKLKLILSDDSSSQCPNT
jgi:hypothetical protein